MVAIRLRHPRGVTTLDVDPDSQTVDDLRVLIFSATEIPPSQQDIKFGYPPKPLPATSGLLSSIPITRGEQVIVTSAPSAAAPSSRPEPTPPPSIKPLNQTLSAPTPPSAANEVEVGEESVALPGDAGYLQLRVVPDDNSCLFSALGVIFEGGIESAQKLRRVVANEIRADPSTFSDAILGQPQDQYIRKMLEKDAWGGAIELSIFSRQRVESRPNLDDATLITLRSYKTEISSFDVATGRCDRFGEGEYDSRCILVYSGIHYDAVTLSPLPTSPPAFHTTVFPVYDTSLLDAAERLVSQLRAKHYYTDTANFDLRCAICRVGLKGEKGAQEHAKQTGHASFSEH